MSALQVVSLLFRLLRPLFWLGGILLFALGVGIARYLGAAIDWNTYLLGQLWVTSLQAASQLLNEYFDSPADAVNDNRTPFSGGSGALGPGKLQRSTALYIALAFLAVVAFLTVVMINWGLLSPVALMIMALAFIGSFFYSTPPVRLEASGYGELVASILVAFLVPAFAYVLQSGELHWMIPMATFPLTLLHLAMVIAFSMPDYGNDLKYDKKTLMVRMGWESGMNLHNLLILTAFVVLGIAIFSGLPRLVGLPVFLTLPLGLLQIWQVRRIMNGMKPNWTAVTLTALILFAVSAYLMAFSFWIR